MLSMHTWVRGEIEQIIHTIKERACGIFNTLPFTTLPGRIIVEIVAFVLFLLNALSNSVVSNLSPRTVMTGIMVTYKRHCHLGFGGYVKTHEDHDNTLQTRTIGAIAIHPTRNE